MKLDNFNSVYSLIFVFCIITSTQGVVLSQSIENSIEHVEIFYEKDMYAGWPANHGIWIWENEILVGFAKGFHKDLGQEYHSIDRDRTEKHLLARSLDGGQTWIIEDPAQKIGVFVGGFYQGIMRNDVRPQILRVCTEGINFQHSDFALSARMNNIHTGNSRFWYSYDRGHNWHGPCKIPNFGAQGTAARTDYIIDGDNHAMLFLTAAKSNGREGRPFVIETRDGGQEWNFKSWIGPEPEGFSIMPASVRLPENEILVTVRRRESEKRFISAYISRNNGQTWSHLGNPVEDVGIGNPPAMIKMDDGRVALAYAYRSDRGSRLGLKISSDDGLTWGDEITLRENDGADRDVGYARMVQRLDGKLVIIYYWNHALSDDNNPFRYIAATIIDPANLS